MLLAVDAQDAGPRRILRPLFRRHVQRITLATLLVFAVAGCKTGDSSITATNSPGGSSPPTSPPPSNPPDTTRPNVTITSPTSSATFSTNSSSINVGGNAADNVGVTLVTWQVTRPSSGSSNGTAIGTGSWSVTNIALVPGNNVVTITARDAAGNTGSNQLTINYTVPSGNNNATVSWNANSESDLAGYRVYYGTQSGQYQQSRGEGVVVSGATSRTITGLTPGVRYFFAVTAFDTSGNESGYSAEVFKDILP